METRANGLRLGASMAPGVRLSCWLIVSGGPPPKPRRFRRCARASSGEAPIRKAGPCAMAHGHRVHGPWPMRPALRTMSPENGAVPISSTREMQRHTVHISYKGPGGGTNQRPEDRPEPQTGGSSRRAGRRQRRACACCSDPARRDEGRHGSWMRRLRKTSAAGAGA